MPSKRKIIHIDMDAFFAAVEMRDNPSLRNVPMAVGGDADRRGVLSTANYLARKFGVRSAIPSWKAKRLCPDLVIVPSHFQKYKEEGAAIREIFHRFTDLVEPLSLDEAYLDITGQPHMQGSATLVAEEIRRLIYEERQLTASAGVAPNKFLAKVASDWNKPNGQLVITPEEVEDFVKDLPVSKIFGVGKATEKKMRNLDVCTCGDLQNIDLAELNRHFGIRGARLYELARGIDDRPVNPDRIRKSISVEDTFPKDLITLEQCLENIPTLNNRLMERYDKIRAHYFIKKLFVKIKFNDFSCTTVEDQQCITASQQNFQTLITTGWQRKKLPVRLLGVGLRLTQEYDQQLLLWPETLADRH